MGVTARPRFASHVLRASGVCHAHLTQRTYPYVKGGMAMPPSVTCPPRGRHIRVGRGHAPRRRVSHRAILTRELLPWATRSTRAPSRLGVMRCARAGAQGRYGASVQRGRGTPKCHVFAKFGFDSKVGSALFSIVKSNRPSSLGVRKVPCQPLLRILFAGTGWSLRVDVIEIASSKRAR